MSTELDSPSQSILLNEARINFTLSSAMDWGQDIKNPNTSNVGDAINKYLGKSTLTSSGIFKIVWGPAINVGESNNYAANITAVFINTVTKNYILAFSGTNPNTPISDIFEDFDVSNLVNFSNYVDYCPRDAKISKATDTAFKIVRDTKPSSGSSLLSFLQGLPENSTLTVTGHSLGGVLASTFALYLSEWSGYRHDYPFKDVFCQSFAAPTAGNIAFAIFSDMKLTGKLQRFWHPYDVVPMAWNLFSSKKIESIYAPMLHLPKDETNDLNKLLTYFSNTNTYYMQLGSLDTYQQVQLPGDYYSDSSIKLFSDEAGWQHTFGYLKPLSLTAKDLNDGQPWPPKISTLD
ncbi:lipase family protein [Burkholderia diffusa]|uniref:lipase family protein n=1 Tax=Burkholderia diffusa TaxID=488732 RepID=UPI00157A9073|nr:lipase [Burkholderia diffusa]NTY37520.1 lipase [Burkholderia diffusa]